MSSVINTNMASLNAQRNLGSSQSSLATSLQRLSSGLRINSAKDDAAGLAIASRMSTQINGLNQAQRNANDGISLSQTADGALSQVTDSLQRIRELAVQSANSTNSTTDRASLQAEVDQRIAEINRIGSQTAFNGLNLLDGTFTTKSFQIGANANQTIDVAAINDTSATALGAHALSGAGTLANTVASGAGTTAGTTNGVAVESDLTVSTVDASGQNTQTSSQISYVVDSGANIIAAAINSAAGGSVGVTATASNSATISGLSAAGTITFNLDTQTVLSASAGTFTAVGPTAISATISDKNDLSALVSAINNKQSTTGITAAFTTAGNKSSITLSTRDGRNIGIDTFANSNAAVNDSVSFAGTTLTEGGTVDAIKIGTVALSSTRGAITLAGANLDTFATAAAQSTFTSVAALDISTAANAQLAIASVDAALNQVNASRGQLGAMQNRFESVVSNLQTSSENISAARSRIQDTDFASETAILTRNQILQQAGTAMLAQANALPQTVLSLLK